MKQKQIDETEKIEVIAKSLEGLQFGELQITVHDGKIVQVNRIEKKRYSI